MPVRLDMEIIIDDKGAMTIIKRVGDEADKSTKRVKDVGAQGSKAFEDLALKAGAAVAAYLSFSKAAQTASDYMKQSIANSAEAQRIDIALNAALAARGQLTSHNTDALNEYAQRLQETTRFEDDATKAAETRLLQMRVPLEEVPRLMQLAADVSVAKSMDIAEGADAVGRAYNGATRNLEMLIGKMEKQDGTQQTLTESGSKVIAMAEKMLGGSAQQMAQSYTDRVAQLKNAYGNLQEAVGNAITQNPVILAGIKEITDQLTGAITELDGTTNSAYNLRVGFADAAISAAYFGSAVASIGIGGVVGAVEIMNSLAIAVDKAAVAYLRYTSYLEIGNQAGRDARNAAADALEARIKDLQKTIDSAGESEAAAQDKMASLIVTLEAARAAMSPTTSATVQLKNGMGGLADDAGAAAEAIILFDGVIEKLLGEKDEVTEYADTIAKLFKAAMEQKGGEMDQIPLTFASGAPVAPPPPDFEPTLAAQRFFIDVWDKNSEQLVADTQRTMEALGFSLASTLAGFLGQWQQHDGDTRARVADTFAFIGAMSGNIASQMNKNDKKQFEAAKDLRKMQVLMSVATGIMSIWEHWGYLPYVAGALTALVVAEGVMQMGVINSQQFKGQAHSGLDYVPSTGTYLLEQGEAVIPRYRNVQGFTGGGGTQVTIHAYGTWRPSEDELYDLVNRGDEAKSRGLAGAA